MALSISQAVKEAKVSKATIWRSIKEGRLSVTRTDNGEVRIDPVELFRVFEPRTPTVLMASRPSTPPPSPVSRDETADETLRQVIQSHETTIKVQDEALKDLRNRLETTERRLDESERERRQMTQTLTGLLTHQEHQHKTKNSSQTVFWWVLATTLVVSIIVLTVIFVAKPSESPSETKTPPKTSVTQPPSENSLPERS